MERMRERVEQMERDEERLKAERNRLFRAAVVTVRPSTGFGKGVIPKTQWKKGELRITQEAMQIIAEFCKKSKTTWCGGRNFVARKAGVSTAVINEYRRKLLAGEILFDESTQKWIPSPSQS